MTDAWDALVVGGGPAGSASATLLARRGCRVLLLDRFHFPRSKPCGEFMSPGVLEALADLKFWDAIPTSGPWPVPGMDVTSLGGRRLRLQYVAEGAVHQAGTLQRRVLDMGLLRLAARAGVQVEEGVRAAGVIVEDGVVRGVRAAHGPGPMEVRAPLTVIADGARSALARELGLAASPRWPVRLGLVAHYEGVPRLDERFGRMHAEPGGYCGIVPLPGGQVNVAMVVPSDAVRASGIPAELFFDRWIATRPPVRETLADCRRASRVRGVAPVGARCRRSWAPGALVVGDAAGFFDPFTGEGIYRALRGADLVAQIGAASLERGDVAGRGLAGYEGARRQAFGWKQAVTVLVQLFVQYPALMDYALPRLSERPAAGQTLSNVLGDLIDARRFLNAHMLWAALRP